MQRRTKRSGFTLIELLVVVVIIGILASVAVGGYSAAMEKSRNSGVISNCRTIFTGIEQWRSDHTGLPAELTGTSHTNSVCSDQDSGAGDFPTKYVPGGRLPVGPWSRKCQIAFESGFNSEAGMTRDGDNSADTPTALRIGNGEFLVITKEGYYQDDAPTGNGMPPPPGAAPTERRHYGYVYYVGDTSSSRYAVFGIGKIQKDPRCIAVKTNYQ